MPTAPARSDRTRSAVARRDVADALASNARAIRDLSEPQLAAILPVLKQAEHETALALSHWLSRVDGRERYTAHHHQSVLYQLRKAISTVQHRLGHAAHGDLTDETSKAQAVAMAKLRMMVEVGSLQFEGSIRPINLRNATLIQEVGSTLMERHETSARRYAGAVGLDIRQRFAVGLVRNETVDQLTSRIMALGILGARARGPEGIAGAMAGRMFGMARHDAERLVTTEIVHAYNRQHQAGMLELEAQDPGYVKKWDAANDWRVCPYCRGLDGVVSDLQGRFPGGMPYPPLHPRCRCTIVPWRVEWGGAHGLPANANAVNDGEVRVVAARDVRDRGFTQQPGVGRDRLKMERARRAIREGQKEPIAATVNAVGILDITDGRHRLAAAIEADAPIRIRIRRGQ